MFFNNFALMSRFSRGISALLTFIVSFLILAGCSSQPSTQQMTNKTVQLSDYRGKWVVVNYWASWCHSCAAEIPELNAFYFAHKDKDAIVLGVNYEQAPNEELPALTQRMGIMFPSLPADPAPELGITSALPALPMSFIIGPDGTLKKTLLGEQTQHSLEMAMGLPAPQKPAVVG